MQEIDIKELSPEKYLEMYINGFYPVNGARLYRGLHYRDNKFFISYSNIENRKRIVRMFLTGEDDYVIKAYKYLRGRKFIDLCKKFKII